MKFKVLLLILLFPLICYAESEKVNPTGNEELSLRGSNEYIKLSNLPANHATSDGHTYGSKDGAWARIDYNDLLNIPSVGDVAAAANLADLHLVLGDGGAKGVKTGQTTEDASGNVTVNGNLTITGQYFGQTSADGPQFTLFREDSDNGKNYVGVGSQASNDNDLVFLLPAGDPTAGQVISWGVPSSVTFSDGTARDATVGTFIDNGSAPVSSVFGRTGAVTGQAGDYSGIYEPADSTITRTIASGTATLGTDAIASGGCATVVAVPASGVATTDGGIIWTFNADPTATTGYTPPNMLTIADYPTANNVNFRVCNNTGSSITPGAITLNWRVVR